MSPQTSRRLQAFDKWVKQLFNSGMLNRSVIYSTIPFVNSDNEITINNGRMILELPSVSEPYKLYDVSAGARDLIGTSDSLPRILLMGLNRAIANHFVATYKD